MKKLIILSILSILSISALTVADVRPLPESLAWQGYSETMSEDQIYFAKHF